MQCHGQRPQEWGPPQYTYYGSVKHNEPVALTRQQINIIARKGLVAKKMSYLSQSAVLASSEYQFYRSCDKYFFLF